MKGLEEAIVLDVTPGGFVRCPCCGLEGRLVSTEAIVVQHAGAHGPEVRVAVVVDVPRSRHSSRGTGTRRFELRIVEKLEPPLPRLSFCETCRKGYDPWSEGPEHRHGGEQP